MIPVLYTFRRCPYAIRARLAIAMSGVAVEYREILLKNKPASMLQYSPKGTVPVLVLGNIEVIDESLDIMLWALAKNDPERCLPSEAAPNYELTMALIEENDTKFKCWLDCYKYADRYPENSMEYYRNQAEEFIRKLDELLVGREFLLGEKFSLADMAIAPFVRQFAHVDRTWFYKTSYKNLIAWLDGFLNSKLFVSVMEKRELWEDVV